MKARKIFVSIATTLLLVSSTVNAGDSGIISSISKISDMASDAQKAAKDAQAQLGDSLNGLINGYLGGDFYNNLAGNLGGEFFDKMGGYSQAVNQLLGVLGITGNLNCFVDLNQVTIPSLPKLDKICTQANSAAAQALGGLDWKKRLSGKFELPGGLGTVGCDLEVAADPRDDIDICALSKEAFNVLRDPSNPNSGFLDGGGIVINPQRSLGSDALNDTLLKTRSNFAQSKNSAERFYSSGASKRILNNAYDVDKIFNDPNNINTPIAEAISSDKPEVYELLKGYAKTEKAKENAKDTQVGDGWDAHPTEDQVAKEATKARPDYFGLPKTNQEVEDTVASMSKMLSEQFPYNDFAKSLEVYLGVEYGKINQNPIVISVPQAKELETAAFNEFMRSEVTVENKAMIETIDAYTFTAIEKVASSSGRLTAPTQQRLKTLPSEKKLAYVALANKQYTRDALIASFASRITALKERILDLQVEKTRVCSSRFYDNVADIELNKIINSADALVY
ncbi:MAG TPA: hypothetical protein ENK66_02670 [Arcobacter sp.]|nr:hypothetical protein [Arcobacter sp.]